MGRRHRHTTRRTSRRVIAARSPAAATSARWKTRTRTAEVVISATRAPVDMNDRPHVLYHAFGGGLGHAVRTLALARQMVRLVGGRHRMLVNTPFAQTIASAIV